MTPCMPILFAKEYEAASLAATRRNAAKMFLSTAPSSGDAAKSVWFIERTGFFQRSAARNGIPNNFMLRKWLGEPIVPSA